MIFDSKILRYTKVRAAKDHGKIFRSRLAASFSGIVQGSLFVGFNVTSQTHFSKDNLMARKHLPRFALTVRSNLFLTSRLTENILR